MPFGESFLNNDIPMAFPQTRGRLPLCRIMIYSTNTFHDRLHRLLSVYGRAVYSILPFAKALRSNRPESISSHYSSSAGESIVSLKGLEARIDQLSTPLFFFSFFPPFCPILFSVAWSNPWRMENPLLIFPPLSLSRLLVLIYLLYNTPGSDYIDLE